MRLTDGTVLRISGSQKTCLDAGFGDASRHFGGGAAGRWGCRPLLARPGRPGGWWSPLNQLDLEHPLENNVYEELSPLLTRIHGQRREIQRQTQDLKRRQDDLTRLPTVCGRGWCC